MRLDSLSVTLVPVDGGTLLEQPGGQVLGRPGQVYRILIENHKAERAVVRVSLDGACISEDGLVISGLGRLALERPVSAGEHGRFTVMAEGSEAAFGPGGGRDNPNLGLIEVSARWEKCAPTYVLNAVAQQSPRRPWFSRDDAVYGCNSDSRIIRSSATLLSSDAPVTAFNVSTPGIASPVESAAGTALSGHSHQRFISVTVGELAPGEIVVRLRLVIGSAAALGGIHPLPAARKETPIPARPAARP